MLGMTETELRRVRLLESVYDYQRDRPGWNPSLLDLVEGEIGSAEEESWRQLLRELDARGSLWLEETFDLESTTFGLTDNGRREVESRRMRRTDRAARNAAARNAIIRWLYGQPEFRAHDLAPMLTDPSCLFEAAPFSEADLDNALVYLKDNGLVDGVPIAERSNVLRPCLTTAGIDCVEAFNGSVAEYVRRGAETYGNTTITFNGAVSGTSVAWNSRQITQTTMTETGMAGDEVAALVGAIAQALPVLGLDGPVMERLRGQVELIREELASGQPEPSVVTTLLKRVLGKIGEVAENSLGLVLTAYAKDLMRRVGVPLD